MGYYFCAASTNYKTDSLKLSPVALSLAEDSLIQHPKWASVSSAVPGIFWQTNRPYGIIFISPEAKAALQEWTISRRQEKLCLVSTIPLPFFRSVAAVAREIMELLETSFRIHRDEVTRTLIGCPPTAERQRCGGLNQTSVYILQF